MKNKYYVLTRTLNEKVTGRIPQCDGMVKGYDFDSKISVLNLAEYKGRQFPFTPSLQYKLHSKAKLTDLVYGCPGPGDHLVISERFHQVLSRYSIGPHQLFKASVSNKKEEHSYWLLHFVYDLMPEITFDKSVFTYAGKKVSGINSYQDYQQYLKDHDRFGITKAAITHMEENKIKDFDLFVIGDFNQRIYVSERLVEDIQGERLTGIELTLGNELVLH